MISVVKHQVNVPSHNDERTSRSFGVDLPMNLTLRVFAIVMGLGLNLQALEMPVGYSFAGTGLGGPVPSISGSFSGSYTPNLAAPIPGPISPDPSTLDAINLTIAGFTYSLTNTNLTVYTAITGYTFPGTSFSLSGSS